MTAYEIQGGNPLVGNSFLRSDISLVAATEETCYIRSYSLEKLRLLWLLLPWATSNILHGLRDTCLFCQHPSAMYEYYWLGDIMSNTQRIRGQDPFRPRGKRK